MNKEYEIIKLSEEASCYYLTLQERNRDIPPICATLIKTHFILVNIKDNTPINVVGKVSTKDADEYNDSVHMSGMSSKIIRKDGDILDDSSDGPATYIETVLDKCKNEVEPLKTGDLLIVEVEEKSRRNPLQ